MSGVDSVSLHSGASEISVAFKSKEAEKNVLQAVVSKAGFTLGAKV